MEHQVVMMANDRKNPSRRLPEFLTVLCPLDPNLDTQMWYPDEPICARQGMLVEHPWLKTQRKIAKRTRRQDRYYTDKMVQRNCIVGRGMVGLDPERDEEPQLERWLRIHPAKKKLTEEEKVILREKMKKVRIPLGVKS